MRILIGLVPALFWGVMPILVSKFGGRPVSQLMGTVYGCLIISIVSYLIIQPRIALATFIWCFIAGATWSIGQLTQYCAYPRIGVSISFPMYTGMQLIGTTLVGAMFFGCWAMPNAKLIGISAIVLIIAGVIMTGSHKRSSTRITPHNFKAGILLSLFGSLGFITCNSLPKIPSASGWEMLLPLSLGMLVSAGVIALSKRRLWSQKPFWNRTVMKNLLTGILFGIAQCGYFFSMEKNGLSTGFVLSQMCVVISTFGGIIFLHEHKTRRELKLTVAGLILVLTGGFMISLIC